MKIKHLPICLIALLSLWMTISCSTTSAIPDGEQLFTGLKPIKYINYEKNDHATITQLEMEYALASAPNGALFGSSYYRNPFQIKLWIWNAFSQSEDKFSQWITKTFGAKPKLMSQVNPELRASVAENQLKKYGYFNGKVSHKVIGEENKKKAKVSYTVDMGHLWTIDSVRYANFPHIVDSLMAADTANAKIHDDDPFSVPKLEQERQRISSLFRNNGYYYYQPGYTAYLADTINVPGKALLRLQLADSLAPNIMKKWYIGNIFINYRKSFTEELMDSVRRGHFINRFNGRHVPMRMGAMYRNIKLRPRRLYNAESETETMSNLQNTGLFSYANLRFTPRDSTTACDTLDVNVDLMFDKPYDFYIESNVKGKTSGRVGPELVLGLTKRNVFRGGEKLDVNLHGSYEWQTGHKAEGSSSRINSYEYGGDVSLVFPRLVTPWTVLSTWEHQARKRQKHRRRRVRLIMPTTMVSASLNILNRAGYFRRHVWSSELTYDFWTSPQSHHTFTPLALSYEYMSSRTATFDSLVSQSPYLQVSMRDQFVPKVSYTYSYKSSPSLRNPIAFQVTVCEAGNLLSGAYAAFGEKWSKRNKTMFKNPFAQFAKIEADFVKTWQLSDNSAVVGHLNAGVVYAYGNSTQAPYYEQFYVGGANSIRAFNVRSIGPGNYHPKDARFSYIEQTGDIKLLANIEYRPRLFGSLYGALFVDAGNVWALRDDETRPGSKFLAKDFFKQMAVGTGIGLRYDVGLFVIRIDWGIGLHLPYNTSRSGFYNIPHFADGQSIHLAVGYPF